MPLLIAADVGATLLIGGIVAGTLCALLLAAVMVNYGAIWFQAYMSGADVSVLSLIGMSLRQVKPGLIVTAKIMGRQAGLNIDRLQGMSTARLEAHYLAGGNVRNVLTAIIAAQRAGINLDFDRAAAVDLAGRDVLDAVRTSVSPKVIDCPAPQRNGKTLLTAVARNGVELCLRAGHRPDQSGSVDRRGDGRNDHCPRGPRHGVFHRFCEDPHGGAGKTRPHQQERPGRRPGREYGVRNHFDRYRGHGRGTQHRSDPAVRPGRGRYARGRGPGRAAPCGSHRSRAGNDGPGRREPRRCWFSPKPKSRRRWPRRFAAAGSKPRNQRAARRMRLKMTTGYGPSDGVFDVAGRRRPGLTPQPRAATVALHPGVSWRCAQCRLL